MKCKCTDLNIFSETNILKYLNLLNEHKSIGPDGLHPLVIKRCPRSFASVLSRIFSSSFETSIVPDSWKKANITPIFKKGKRSDPANYRPISLTPVLCKMMERIIRNEMIEHLTINNLIAPEQHGFVTNKSCLTNLLETVDINTDTIDSGYRLLIIFLDFATAFDKVCHRSLLVKLKTY